MRHIFLIFLIASVAALVIACEPSEEKLSSSGDINLTFSTDTVLFDTLLTARTSITKRLRIFNTSKKAVSISSIRLGAGSQSPYTIIANGKFGSEIRDEVLFGGDSLLVLIDVEIDPQDEDLPYLVKDSVIVDWNGKTANAKLVAWGQDANYLNGDEICDETWTSARPYVIFNLAIVDTSCVLTMNPGTKVYLDNGASLIMFGTLKVRGDTADRVVFRNTRLDENYLQAPGQWGGIIFMESSRNNEISHAIIENGDIGIGVGYSIGQFNGQAILLPESGPLTSQVTIDHTTIRHMSTAGILAFSSEVTASNTEVYNCGTWLVGNFAGGTYSYEHCTFSNSPSMFNLKDPSFQYSDNIEIGGEQLLEDLSLSVKNSIIWGSNDQEVARSFSDEVNVSDSFDNNIIRSKEEIENNFTSIKSTYPGFNDPFDFDFSLDTLSNAKDKGLQLNYATDIRGMERGSKPDIGAYERIEK